MIVSFLVLISTAVISSLNNPSAFALLAFDCELNRDVNIYSDKNYGKEIPLMTSNNKQIKISLADKPYSRSCFYMKECKFVLNN